MNASDVPDYIFERFNQAYVAAGSPNGALNAGSTARARGLGRAFGFANASLGGLIDNNLANAAGNVIGFESRGPILGFNIPEAVLLDNTGRSLYHSLQVNFLRRMSQGLQFNLSYTYSRSKDTSSADPGSTSGGGKPDTPNVGFAVQGNQRDIDANYALSDFDRPHRFSTSFIYELPGFARGFRLSGFVQVQSGLPYSIFSAEPELGRPRNTPISFAGREVFIDWPLAGRACAARWTSFASPGPNQATRPSTRPCSVRRAASRAAIPTTRASAISGGTFSETSGNDAWT